MPSTALTLIDGRPLPTRPLNVESLPQHERDRHRAEIGVVVEAMLTSWFSPSISEAAATAVLIDWMDELQGFRPNHVREAFVAYRDREPNRRPNPAHIKAILAERWGKRVLAEAEAKGLLARPEPEARTPVSAERASAILAEVGFRPRRVEGAIE